MKTVAQVLTTAMDSVDLINAIKDGTHSYTSLTQAELNEVVQRNVDHLEIILSYTTPKPNVVGSSNSKKTNCTTAIATGKQYITDNT